MNDLPDYVRRASWRFTAAAAGSGVMDVVLGPGLIPAVVVAVGAAEIPAAYLQWRETKKKSLRQRDRRLAELRAEQPERNAEFDRRTRFAGEVVDAFVDSELARLGRPGTPASAQEARHRSLVGRRPLVPPVDDPRFAEHVRIEAARVRAELIDTVTDSRLGRIVSFGEAAAALDKVIEAATAVIRQPSTAEPETVESARDIMLDAVENAGGLLPGFAVAPRSSPESQLPPATPGTRHREDPRPQPWSPVPPRVYTGPPDQEHPVAPVLPPLSPEDFEVPDLPIRQPDAGPEDAGLESGLGVPPVSGADSSHEVRSDSSRKPPGPCAWPPSSADPDADHRWERRPDCADTEPPELSRGEDAGATRDSGPWLEECPPTGPRVRAGMPLCFSVLPRVLVFALLPGIERLLVEELASGRPVGDAPESGFHCRTLCEAVGFLRYATRFVPVALCVVAHYAVEDTDGRLTLLSRIVWPE